MNSQLTIGVFDSGVGGLSVVREIMAQLPAQPIVYLADQANAPYGQRDLEEIRGLAEGIARFLLAQGAQVIVVACNTASAAALHWLRRRFPETSFVGMEPAVKPAAERTRTGHVGVVATAATFQGELFASLLDRYAGNVAIHTQVCPDLVPLVEAGELDSPRVRQAVQTYMAPLLAARIDQLVLGCTHYPFLRPLFEEVAGPGVAVIDPAPAVARQAGRVLAQHDPPAGHGPGAGLAAAAEAQRSAEDGRRPPTYDFYTTGDPARFRAAVSRMLGLTTVVTQAAWRADGLLSATGAGEPA